MGRKDMAVFPIRLGVHVSIAGGMEKAIDRARELGCSAMQVFSRNPRGWKTSPLSSRSIAAFQDAAEKWDIDPIVVHTPYLLNLASPEERLYQRSIRALALDVQRASQLGARYVVTHLGSAKEKGKVFGVERVVEALKIVLRQPSAVSLLLENSAGAGHSIGVGLEELKEIIKRVGEDDGRLRVCFDSCHGYAAGYDFRTPRGACALAEEIKRTIGWQRLALLHLNDCSGELGSHLDRHEHIGQGKIGLSGFRALLRCPSFQRVPMILETPKKSSKDDLENLARIRQIFKRKKSNWKN
ncbi:MAG: deoxyribonuclease IV [Thermodesulfobacteriota bacterium]|nr:deoxyribonuclease IV [Thermodesulfobacteriota bacterium]